MQILFIEIKQAFLYNKTRQEKKDNLKNNNANKK